jgi:hypothetical protein
MGGYLPDGDVHREMELSPGSELPAVLLGIPLTLAEQLQASAVQHEVDRVSAGRTRGCQPANVRPRWLKVEWSGEQLKSEKTNDAAGEPFRFVASPDGRQDATSAQADRQIGVARLAAWCDALRCRPSNQSRLVQPKGEIAASSQVRLIRRPVCDTIASRRNTTAAGGMVLNGIQGSKPAFSGRLLSGFLAPTPGEAASLLQHSTR